MRHTGLDENEVPGLMLDAIREILAIIMPNSAFEDIEHHLEADVNVGAGHSSGGNRRNVHRQGGGPDVLTGHAELVLDAVPVTAEAAPSNPRQSGVLLDLW